MQVLSPLAVEGKRFPAWSVAARPGLMLSSPTTRIGSAVSGVVP
jgi:hypothetical protein